MRTQKKRVALIGAVETTALVFDLLASNDRLEFVSLITRASSRVNSDYVDLSLAANARGVPVHYLDDLRENQLEEVLRSVSPDVVFCVGWSWLLNERVLRIPKYGCIGYHPAALPKNRGRHPLIWALALGLTKTASTFFVMDGGADTGAILSQQEIAIADEDDARSLYNKILHSIPDQIEKIIDKYLFGNLLPCPQDHSQASTWRKRTKSDGEICWKMDAQAVYNLVRALTHPYVGAHTCYAGGPVKIWKVRVVDAGAENNEPGKVLSVNGNEFTIKCATGAVRILEHEFKEIPKSGSYL